MLLQSVIWTAGEVKVPDVMFPNGSPHLVEPIYKDPKLSAPFNEQLAGAHTRHPVSEIFCPLNTLNTIVTVAHGQV